ncbi:hypothetical protein GH714_020496 [Hevea brasiliensis]|uniref:MLO-like protein n=1 Tax=Hevea brasiliensis TaxID=3981 RepID=A0A6A6L9U7_HEVBR|nr:hypothetical protein GH714_020496 [Hevea brasiliensis]
MAGGVTLEYTPTWVVAVVCTFIVIISLSVERFLHYLGKFLKKKNQKPLFEALLKIKEELMLLGFISLLLTVFQDRITSICISEDLANKWLPCKKKSSATGTAHFQTFFSFFPGGSPHRLLAEASDSTFSCSEGKVPVLSLTALHHLHIFIFVLAVVHVAFCALTILFGGAKIRQWKHWEDSILNKDYDLEEGWNAYFWIAFIPFILLLAVGTKLEHTITQLAHEVAEKHVAVEGDLVVKPSDAHFWFQRPQIVLILIHVILFQNSFELAFFFWVWVQYGFDSCIMGKTAYIIPRLIIGAFIQFVCSYSTLPLYAIVTQAKKKTVLRKAEVSQKEDSLEQSR